MGRTSDARRRVLDAACELIGRRGYTALGVAEICATAGVPKGSFYYFFDSKQSLTLSVIDEHWTTQRGEWERALRSERPPLVRLRDLFEATAATQQRAQDATGSVNGCVFANLALELSNQDEPARNRLQQVFEEQIDLVHEVIADAIDQGFVPASHGGRSRLAPSSRSSRGSCSSPSSRTTQECLQTSGSRRCACSEHPS
jgi:TetR/AcrR family transcriptional repressor of nem operon